MLERKSEKGLFRLGFHKDLFEEITFLKTEG